MWIKHNQDGGGYVDLITTMKGLFRARFYCYACHKTYSTSTHICLGSSCVLCRQAECKNRCGRLDSYQVGGIAPCTACGMKMKTQLRKDAHTSPCASLDNALPVLPVSQSSQCLRINAQKRVRYLLPVL